MTRSKSSRLILILILAEAIVIGAIFLMRQNVDLGFLASANRESNSNTTNSSSQKPTLPVRGKTVTVDRPTSTPTVSSEGVITLNEQSPTAPTGDSVSPSPTLAQIKVVTPSPTGAGSAIVKPVNPSSAAKPSGSSPASARLVIQSIGVDSPIVEMGYTLHNDNGQEVADWQVPQDAVGHMIGSSNPGAPGNVVLSGHNNIYGSVFKKLYTLQAGDFVIVYNVAGSGFLYRVTQAYIVQEQGAALSQRLANARVLLPTDDARVTLISCWPETGNSERAIVIGALVGLLK